MKFKLMLASVFVITSAHAALDEAWPGFSRPDIMASGFVHKMSELPLEGTVKIGPKAWSGGYWANQLGGINLRWNSANKEGFNYASPSKAQVAKMTLAELAQLSPSEKYDLFIGRYDYPLKNKVAASVSSAAPDWAGICHGWAPASLNHNEPTPKVVTNPDGIKIPFGSSDIKALLSFYYAKYHESNNGTHQMGRRCTFGTWLGGSKNCDQDLNAGAFHIVITNMLGIRHEGFVADMDRYKEVWNQPVVAYKTTIVSSNIGLTRNAASRAVKEMRVKTEFFYADESDNATWEVAAGTKEQQIAKKDLTYRLDIDAGGRIVGGTWETEARPDFFWNKEKATEFPGLMSQLPALLND